MLFLLCILSCSLSIAVEITEATLVNLSTQNAPRMEEIRAALYNIETDKNEVEEKFAPELFGKALYAETKEKAIIEFQPVFSPVKQARLGVRQKLSYGLNAELLATSDQRTGSSSFIGKLDNITTTIFSFTLQMDLWRDLLGRMTDTERKNADLDAKKARLEESINKKAFELTLRRIYWSMVANQESIRIAEGLTKSSKEQLADARKRKAAAVADEGEVARYEAQLASRTGQVIFLNYQKETLIKQLKTLLPDLGTVNVELGKYDIDKTINQVVTCSQLISARTAVPYDFTQYDEMVKLLREIRSNKRIINDRYSDVDVKIYGTIKSTGIANDKLNPTLYQGSFRNSIEDMKNNNRSGYETGITVSLPLGDYRKNTETTKTLYDDKRYLAAIDNTDSQVVSTHTQLAKSMALISAVIKSQKAGSDALKRRLVVVKQKYSQARVTVSDFIEDQDALLNAELNTINAQLQAVNVLFDYFMVFNETPCEFNRI